MEILIDREYPEVTIITLNRPEKRNALSLRLMEQFLQALENTHKLIDQRVIVIRAEGSVFCSGMDLAEAMQEGRSADLVADVLKALYLSPLVTIALVHGTVMGGGAGLMSACDFVLADPATKFGYPEVRRGLVPAQVLAFLMRQLHQRDVRELVLLGEMVDAARAKEMGLINHIVPKDDQIEMALKLAASIRRGAPKALAEAKHLIDVYYPVPFEEDLYQGLTAHRSMRQSDEAEEGIKAFLEKREPKWR